MSRKVERSEVALHNHVIVEKKARAHGELASETLNKLVQVDGSKECRGIQEAADVAEGTDGGSGGDRLCPGDVVKAQIDVSEKKRSKAHFCMFSLRMRTGGIPVRPEET
ncbi:hypothetical protein B0H11DRAFT_2239532 [Mycena galericulata]|nr:hypothetical protein B0H11DRAFT_2239532 [Mycena galericulata]